MLQQTQVKTVIPYWEWWMRRFPTVRALARAKVSDVLRCWAGLGYYTRARNLQRAACLIVSNHAGNFPRTFGEIITLPGIGRYTAGAICSIAFNQPAPILDGNVTRVLTRIFGIATHPAKSRTQRRLWSLAQALVSFAAENPKPQQRSCADLNQALMELGATVCAPRQPKCERCPCRQFCRAFREGRVEQYPVKLSRPKTALRRLVAFAVRHRGRFLVRQRPPDGVNADLWEFPNLETNGRAESVQSQARRCLGFRARDVQALCVVNHTITRYRIQLEVFTATTDVRLQERVPRTRWCTARQLRDLAFPGAHQRIVVALREKAGPRKPH